MSIFLVTSSNGVVTHSLIFLFSASVNLGSVANACQYLGAAFPSASDSAFANADPTGSTRIVIAKVKARIMNGSSFSRRLKRNGLESSGLLLQTRNGTGPGSSLVW